LLGLGYKPISYNQPKTGVSDEVKKRIEANFVYMHIIHQLHNQQVIMLQMLRLNFSLSCLETFISYNGTTIII